ncbi:site-specific integrase [Pseudanabaena sp. PCC 6802]|uniref:site-specific integrase n=1 Tax=Pseudanabaena sp. PCC 6802 TaxID=118173 RepID=UPI00034CF372|nr:site-specific integrase [Pseudanabaena sp. PCC 6802]
MQENSSTVFAMTEVQPPRLLDQVRQVIRLKHMSIKTEDSYVYYIRDFILYHNKKHPRDMGAPEIRAYLSHLAIAKNAAASTQNVARNALDLLQIRLRLSCQRTPR